LVVIRRLDGVAQRPKAAERLQERQSEAENPRMRRSSITRVVGEGNLQNPPSRRVTSDENLFEHVEVAPAEIEVGKDARPVQSETAREVADGKAEADGEEAVQNT